MPNNFDPHSFTDVGGQGRKNNDTTVTGAEKVAVPLTVMVSEAPPPKEEEAVQPFAAPSEEFAEGERTHA